MKRIILFVLFFASNFAFASTPIDQLSCKQLAQFGYQLKANNNGFPIVVVARDLSMNYRNEHDQFRARQFVYFVMGSFATPQEAYNEIMYECSVARNLK